MKPLKGTRETLGLLDKHIYMCDLVYLEGPVLSLFRDHKQNWLYLWCDTDNVEKERWLLFPVSRTDLIDYLEKRAPLLDLVKKPVPKYLLDFRQKSDDEKSAGKDDSVSTYRHLVRVGDMQFLDEYLPTERSYFNEELAPNISLAQELNPGTFEVPIKGDWFISDLDNFSNLYSQLYAFFYCTKPQFITDIGARVKRYLTAPWQGGFSRVHLFDALARMIPSIHDLKIKKIYYASPGGVNIEALSSVGDRIRDSVLRFLENQSDIKSSIKRINAFLSSSKLRKVDLSAVNDSQLSLPKEEIAFLHEEIASVINALSMTKEWSDISSHSPNVVVSSKVLIAVIARIERLAEFQRTGLLDYLRGQGAVIVDGI
ncbi:hypothetical protein J2X56_003025 [Herbaspirillum sp. 1173]|uniref:hypothetical protein n=1 Tax=Herbaspirillum sp. 1173 TaxID=2817734 RepID=UPI00285D4048|nr:hypothetical protein [Herbaspirillum sp. 1173]MDR6741001.1 hypothetical protein [Herbaspirillum sp. 1173]